MEHENINLTANVTINGNEVQKVIETEITKYINDPNAMVGDLSLDYVVDQVMTKIDYNDMAENISDYISISDIASRVEEDLNYDAIASMVVHEIDMDDLGQQASQYLEFNVEDEAYGLLRNYNPENSCRTGEEFTDAIEKAIYYILKERSLSEEIYNSVNQFKSDRLEQMTNELSTAYSTVRALESRIQELEIRLLNQPNGGVYPTNNMAAWNSNL